jgi:ATP-dependent helicase Lhr and Lhr-like helicase
VLEQLQGYEAAAVAWEPELISRRLRGYDAAWLDRLCHEGAVAWLRLTPRDRDPDAPPGAPSRATPISVVLRSDLPWLLAAARHEVGAALPDVGSTAEIIDALGTRGACFASELAGATRRLPEDIEQGLWDGISRGLLMSDGFGAIRARVSRSRRPVRPYAYRAGRMSTLRRAARTSAAAAGRWSLVSSVAPLDDTWDRDELAEAVAEQLLNRWGVVFRELAIREAVRLPWRDLQWALRRLEDRGLIRGGRFVSGFSGEQYAVPEAMEQLAYIRKLPAAGEAVTVNATDPLNLVGVIVPGATVPSVHTRDVTYVDGVPASHAASSSRSR